MDYYNCPGCHKNFRQKDDKIVELTTDAKNKKYCQDCRLKILMKK
jgi:DNA-directed RNA polymerase subunit RPC12/RpoP